VPLEASEQLLCGAEKLLDVPAGEYYVRAGAPGLTVAWNGTVQVMAPVDSSIVERLRVDLVPAAKIRLGDPVFSATRAVEMLSVTTGRYDTLFHERERELQFPAGSTIAIGLRSAGDFVGATKPFQASAGAPVTLDKFHKPKPGTGDVAIVMKAPAGLSDGEFSHIGLRLKTRRSRIEPLVVATSNPGYLYFFFYDVPADEYALQLISEDWRPSLQSIRVRSDSFQLIEDVSLVGAVSLRLELRGTTQPGNVEFYDCSWAVVEPGLGLLPDRSQCDHYLDRSVSPGDPIHVRNCLTLVIVSADGHSEGRLLDLATGGDRTEVFDFRRVKVSGTTTLAQTPSKTTLAFASFDDGESESVESNAQGLYETSLAQGRAYHVVVRSLDEPIRQLSSWIDLQKATDGELHVDFDIPNATVALHVKDATSGEPVSGASVGVLINGLDEDFVCDAGGDVLLSLPAGETSAWVGSDGYESKKVQLVVTNENGKQDVEVRLRRLRDENSFQAMMADGQPAAGTLVIVGADASAPAVPCDATGRCLLPDRPPDDSLLFLMQRSSGLTVMRAGPVLAQGSAILEESGGTLRVKPERGPNSRPFDLKILVQSRGVWLPDTVIAMMAAAADQPYRPYVLAGEPLEFLLPGLPSGEALVQVARIQARPDHSLDLAPLGDAVMVSMPLETAVDVRLP
jgi:hypothetical protein